MNEPVIDIRDRIEKMRNQMTPQSSQNKENSIIKTSKNFEKQTDKLDSEKKDSIEIQSKDKDAKEHKKSISEDIVDRKREFNKSFEDTETITQINVEKNDKKRSSFSSRAEQNEGSFEEKSKSVTQEETTFPQFSLNVSNPISWKLMLLIMVMQLLTNIMLVVVLYLK
jgi:hypothetical protein